MDFLLHKHSAKIEGEVLLSSSKSESNRALLIHALSNGQVKLSNLSDAQDTQTMQRLLKENPETWDVIDAGTTMRFLTAYLAINGTEKTITGSARMKERPIGPLVEALRLLGSKIDYREADGYPPIQISKVAQQTTDEIQIPGNISSQYISALLMIAPTLPKGLTVQLTTEIFSRPYINMTLSLMKLFGATYQWEGQTIYVDSAPYSGGEYTIENDWSGASYWFGFIALSPDPDSSVTIPLLRDHSFQGDRRVATIMSDLGVHTEFLNGKIKLSKKEVTREKITLDLKDCPDLAQTIMVVASVVGVAISFTGLESLKIKETDRIQAMQNELQKVGATLIEDGNTWVLNPTSEIPDHVEIATYLDHRMAMAFAPLCQRTNVLIKDAGVVKKSYPVFWEAAQKVGIKITE
ncbi:MAG: 3-phosphoshikimate 1-carboxyvinyltransferase [Bacteroidota bacterium]